MTAASQGCDKVLTEAAVIGLSKPGTRRSFRPRGGGGPARLRSHNGDHPLPLRRGGRQTGALLTAAGYLLLYCLSPSPALAQAARPSLITEPTARPLKPLPARKRALPDLLVEKIRLNANNEIILSLSNSASAIDKATHKDIPLKLCIASTCTTYYLGRRSGREKMVDPARVLSRDKSRMEFNTRKRISRGATITAHINHTRRLQERNDSNNSATAVLSPITGTAGKSPPARPGNTIPHHRGGFAFTSPPPRTARRALIDMPMLSVALQEYRNRARIDMPALFLDLKEYNNTADIEMPALRVSISDYTTSAVIDMPALAINLAAYQNRAILDMPPLSIHLNAYTNRATVEMPMLHIDLRKHIKARP